MPKGRPERPLLPAPSKQHGDPSSSSGQQQQQPPPLPDLANMILTFNAGDVAYNTQDHAMDSHPYVMKHEKSIQSSSDIYLMGPMHVGGPVKSMGSVSFGGDVFVRDRIETYGNIEVGGNVSCFDKIISHGNLDITGYAFSGKVKVSGKLTVNGLLEVNGDIEVWGAVVIQGHIKCKTLTAHASVTAVADSFYCEVGEAETVWGARMVRHAEYGA